MIQAARIRQSCTVWNNLIELNMRFNPHSIEIYLLKNDASSFPGFFGVKFEYLNIAN